MLLIELQWIMRDSKSVSSMMYLAILIALDEFSVLANFCYPRRQSRLKSKGD